MGVGRVSPSLPSLRWFFTWCAADDAAFWSEKKWEVEKWGQPWVPKIRKRKSAFPHAPLLKGPLPYPQRAAHSECVKEEEKVPREEIALFFAYRYALVGRRGMNTLYTVCVRAQLRLNSSSLFLGDSNACNETVSAAG